MEGRIIYLDEKRNNPYILFSKKIEKEIKQKESSLARLKVFCTRENCDPIGYSQHNKPLVKIYGYTLHVLPKSSEDKNLTPEITKEVARIHYRALIEENTIIPIFKPTDPCAQEYLITHLYGYYNALKSLKPTLFYLDSDKIFNFNEHSTLIEGVMPSFVKK